MKELDEIKEDIKGLKGQVKDLTARIKVSGPPEDTKDLIHNLDMSTKSLSAVADMVQREGALECCTPDNFAILLGGISDDITGFVQEIQNRIHTPV